MAIVLENALLADYDPVRIEPGELRIEGDLIVERGPLVARELNDEIVDCRGGLVLPGLVNGHTHLYSALAVGMPPTPKTPTNFVEKLEYVWWRLDRAHNSESIEMSARVGALEALRRGTTMLFDHHASPNSIEGSLDLIEKGVGDVGLRAVLCYETTDRHGRDGRLAGLEENRRYLEKRLQHANGQFAGMAGAHASFTLEDDTLEQLAGLATDFDTGVHMHVAEDACDEDDCQEKFQSFLIDRLSGIKLLKPQSVFAHCTHFDPEAIARLREARVTIAHCPRSNMNNGVGTAPMAAYNAPVMLGTDGHSSDMFLEARIAWLAARQDGVNLPPEAVLARIAQAARRASAALHVTLGKLEADAAADIVITDYAPNTALDSQNFAGHFLFALGAEHVRDVFVSGAPKLRDRVFVEHDAANVRRASAEVAGRLWKRMANL